MNEFVIILIFSYDSTYGSIAFKGHNLAIINIIIDIKVGDSHKFEGEAQGRRIMGSDVILWFRTGIMIN